MHKDDKDLFLDMTESDIESLAEAIVPLYQNSIIRWANRNAPNVTVVSGNARRFYCLLGRWRLKRQSDIVNRNTHANVAKHCTPNFERRLPSLFKKGFRKQRELMRSHPR